MKIGVMDYKAGNIRSVESALRHFAVDFVVSDRPEVLQTCDKLIIPGDGEARATMDVLRETGLGDFIRDFFRTGDPILGICIGCQIVLDHSEERNAECLGLIPGEVLRFPNRPGLKVPHMGWNAVRHDNSHKIFQGVPNGAACYFVHSYYPSPREAAHRIAQTDYGFDFASGVARDNLVALQFHPEKSSSPGLKMMENFVRVLQTHGDGRYFMLLKRVIICLDVRNGKTTKGIKFKGNVDIGDPVEMARDYYLQGVDELVFYDITASSEQRRVFLGVVEKVAENIFIPFCVGGGLSSAADMRDTLLAGAEKVSLNSQAVKNPRIIEEGASLFGSQAVVLGMDVLADAAMPSGYRIVINGGRTPTELDALAWALDAEKRGAGEIVVNSIDADGTKNGYEIRLTRMISEAVGIPVVASGGAGRPEHLARVLTEGKADAALIASMVHYGEFDLASIKNHLASEGIPVRREG